MIKKKKLGSVTKNARFLYSPEMKIDNKVIQKGDTIRVQGEYGAKFRFESLTTNVENGVQWIDCFELHRGIACRFRSFSVDKVRRVPKKRVKRVN